MGNSRTLFGRATLLLCLAGGILQGCGTEPTRLEANVIAADDVNKDEAGRALPIVVRIYELKAVGGFQGADFYNLYEKDADVLGSDVLAREELNLRPGQQYEINRGTAPEAQYIGILGAFRDIDNASWKTTHPLTPGEINKVEVHLGPNAVSIR